MIKKPARPPAKGKDLHVGTRPYQIRMTDEFVKMLDDWRRRQDDLPSRAEALRRLALKGFNANKK
jgi:hypothetical protein